jgi:predicted nucleic acid-binding Zn ribbon protein
MTEMLPEHDHCQVCDDPVDLGQRFCSQKCEDDFKKDTKKEKFRSYLFLVAIGIVVIAVTFTFLTI